MRRKSCTRTFSQPSKITRDTQTCAVCRGTKTCLKSRDFCEESPSFLINQIPSQIPRIKNNITFGSDDQGYQKVYSRSI